MKLLTCVTAVALIFVACDSGKRQRLQDQLSEANRTIETQRKEIATLKSKSTSPPQLTRELAASVIAKNDSFTAPLGGPGFENCYRVISKIAGVSYESPTLAIIDFTWHPEWQARGIASLSQDERNVADYTAASRAIFRLFDDGWRLERVSNLDGHEGPGATQFLVSSVNIMDKAVDQRPK